MLVFVLRKAALVEFVVVQVSPECRRVGRFRVWGREGRNRIPFKGRVGRTVLAPGTYRIRAKQGRRRVLDARLVVVSRRKGAGIAAARSADVCATAAGTTAGASSFGSSGPTAAAHPARKTESKAEPRRSKGALGAQFATEVVQEVASIPLWLYLMLGAAIALLAAAVHREWSMLRDR